MTDPFSETEETIIQTRDPEKNRIAFVQTCFGLIGLVTLAIMGVLAFQDGKLLFTVMTAIFWILLLSAVIILKTTGSTGYTSVLFSLVIICLSLGLLATGGVQNNGPMWVLVFPPLLFFMNGILWGALPVIIIAAGSLPIFFLKAWPFLYTTYPDHFKIRFVLAFICISLIAFVAEWSRDRLHKTMLDYARQLVSLSITDALTGVNNRRGGLEKLEYIDAISRRNLKTFSLILLDLDHFKRFNDDWGHDCGDLVLKEIAGLLVATVRKQDVVIRWGGEEFLIVLPETGITDAFELTKRIQSGLKAMVIHYKENHLKATASFGLSECRPDESVNEAIKKADQALYRAKESGRDRIVQDNEALL